MRTKQINIPIYDIGLTLVEIETKDDYPILEPILDEHKIDVDEKEIIKDFIEREVLNGGSTYGNFALEKMLVILYQMNNEEERRAILNHEKRHVVDRICEFLSINDIEAPAYLDGYISRYMY